MCVDTHTYVCASARLSVCMVRTRVLARARARARACVRACVRVQLGHAVSMCVCACAQVDTLVDSLPLCMLIMGQKNSDVVTMYS